MKRKSTRYSELMKHHDRAVASSVRKYLANIPHTLNADIFYIWSLEEQRFQKQFGRARRVYNRIA